MNTALDQNVATIARTFGTGIKSVPGAPWAVKASTEVLGPEVMPQWLLANLPFAVVSIATVPPRVVAFCPTREAAELLVAFEGICIAEETGRRRDEGGFALHELDVTRCVKV